MKSAYPQVKKNIVDGVDEWTEIDKEAYDQYYELCPPLRMNGNWFFCGEIDFSLTNGQDVGLACKEIDGRYYAKLMTLNQYDSREKIKPDYVKLMPTETKLRYQLL